MNLNLLACYAGYLYREIPSFFLIYRHTIDVFLRKVILAIY